MLNAVSKAQSSNLSKKKKKKSVGKKMSEKPGVHLHNKPSLS